MVSPGVQAFAGSVQVKPVSKWQSEPQTCGVVPQLPHAVDGYVIDGSHLSAAVTSPVQGLQAAHA